jgi:hypothetical protein
MRLRTSSILAAITLAASACFHQVVQTGRSPGSTVIDLPWTKSFIFGLVPPAEINTAAQCPGGVATVETQRSFVNGLVGTVTFGIFTPVSVRITCAGGAAMLPGARRIDVAEGASLEARAAAVRQAIEVSSETLGMVVVQY